MFSAALSGFLLGASLIIAIGAQNAFILRQGLLRQHVFILSLICALSDALLITAGVAGLGTLIARSPTLISVVTLGGAAFLFWYASVAFRRALHPEVLEAASSGNGNLKMAIGTVLALTFLNPHVYLDTVVLLGGLSARFEGASRAAYGAGAALSSFVWFFGLGYGARLLQPIFAKPAAWRVLDVLIGLVMAGIGLSLLVRFLNN
ncbi:LysE/ArgO family amino acid transporter [Phyllobacterium endophyticum]|jgi:L-lysine exporter family protein LysE/ArgO|uniref:Amino acid transporter n=1 Tax=Phyllobacterium endophyticum TaxID=1149773 RepID=A0A2P7AWN6_9HYPH|nr:LysE/ArgO family amino acid transporter [Phyllobacterium endophyticum]MBB3235260.1 L-lysine exporter family protein LysE/ArgO [Phyllobacterium endophyticum]PSH58628.1 amino acid transporter [Phyllobacterium endophyticum]TXR46703.1 amino acid transporter [Phyllobacterium endophyticum]TYR39315.1 amino acid transporter [Phyllobacterium endophyticum]